LDVPPDLPPFTDVDPTPQSPLSTAKQAHPPLLPQQTRPSQPVFCPRGFHLGQPTLTPLLAVPSVSPPTFPSPKRHLFRYPAPPTYRKLVHPTPDLAGLPLHDTFNSCFSDPEKNSSLSFPFLNSDLSSRLGKPLPQRVEGPMTC